MTAEEFVAALPKTAPSVEDLRKQGLTKKAAQAFRRSLSPKAKKDGSTASKEGGEVARLITGYDCSSTEVGMVRFIEAPIRKKGSWEVGRVEADPLLVDATSGAVRVVEMGHPSHVLWDCAANGESFLSALARASAALSQRVVEEVPKKQMAKHLRNCVFEAGGEQYEAFFRMLLGA